jgi:hypothetical protein
MQHGGICPAGCALNRNNLFYGSTLKLKQVCLEWPGTRGSNAFVPEIIHLNEGIMPVAVDQLTLLAQQIDGSVELILVQGVGSSIPSSGW